MFEETRRRRAARRVTPGDGRPLKPFRWWQMTFRALFYLRLTNDDGRQAIYAVDVRHWQNNSSGNVKADLYLDDRHHAQSGLPAAFPVPGGTVEVRMSAFGLKRCHYVSADGAEYQLVPDRDSAEGRRAHFDRRHPALSRGIGFLSSIVLVVALFVLVAQLVEQLTLSQGVSQHVGTFTSPIDLSAWGNTVIGLITVTASTERALRLRYSRLLDGAAG
ncbi:hypothetical protein RI578_07430 [Streptomyces sp. BB1-1-1]|uniref:SMODS and SLOG-associating 2TM effector domain-containing protein n=1 Tax=Streptomyces thinghirensis TaxID=551547 RepID=A0ABP9SYC1_9ACTN|nr:hypothetical protein [Streptomyces sp. BB1-1-1]WND34128.1 hypothetical protein RI578_07430 [Streptomyces sp. BB1-1-1]